MSNLEKRASYRFALTGLFVAMVVTLLGTQDLLAGVFNGLVLALLFQLVYQIRLQDPRLIILAP